MVSLDRASTSTGYEFQAHQRRRQKKRDRGVTGNISNNHGTFKGAPEPERDIFIYLVDQAATVDSISVYMKT